MATPKIHPDRYTTSEACRLTGLTAKQLKCAEKRLPGFLDIVRTPGGRRRYSHDCVEKLQTLYRLVDGKGLSWPGAAEVMQRKGLPEGEFPSLADLGLLDKRLSQSMEELARAVHAVLLDEMA